MRRPPLEAIKRLKLLISDIDGVITDGLITVDDDGQQFKSTHVHDGLAVRLWQDSGRCFAIVSAGYAPGIESRFNRLGVEEFHHRVKNKAEVCLQLMERLRIPADATAYVGDDLPDLSAMSVTGLAIAPCNSTSEVLARADWITATEGGQGALREVITAVLRATGELDGVAHRWVQGV